MPGVIENNEVLTLSPSQRNAYNAAILEYSKKKNDIGFLALFNKLRALCDVEPHSGASSKVDRIVELLTDIATVREKVVVFSYILEPLRLLGRRIAAEIPDIGYAILTGEMTLAERATALENFKTKETCTTLLASTRVASEGLNLTEANHVIFINRWWNPSANAQARDRVVRIGQSRLVHVKTFTCKNTVEERLEDLFEKKSTTFRELIEALATSTNTVDRKFLSLA